MGWVLRNSLRKVFIWDGSLKVLQEKFIKNVGESGVELFGNFGHKLFPVFLVIFHPRLIIFFQVFSTDFFYTAHIPIKFRFNCLFQYI